MTNEIAPCPMPGCRGECVAQEAEASDVDLAFVTCMTCGYQGSNEERCEEAIIAHNALCADVTLARNLRKVTRKGHVQCGPGKDRKTFAAACLARPNLLGVEIIRGRCAWNDTLDAALDELTALVDSEDRQAQSNQDSIRKIGTSIGPDEGHDKVGGGNGD